MPGAWSTGASECQPRVRILRDLLHDLQRFRVGFRV